MTDSAHVYILTRLCIDDNGNVTSRNVGVTLDLLEAETHRGDGIDNDFEVFTVSGDWREDAAQSDLVVAMREFREIVQEQIEQALR
jgi:hypothetical protein